MTEPRDPNQEATELASAYLDGEASDAEAARVEADPALLALVDSMREARERVQAAPSAVDPARREAAIAAALAAFDEQHAADAPEAPVTSLVDVAARRAGTSTRTLRIVAVAAVIALVALAVPLLAGLGGGDDDDAATEAVQDSSGDSGGDDFDASAGAGPDAAEDGELEAPASGSPPVGSAGDLSEDAAQRLLSLGYATDLGSFSDLTELEDAARAALGAERASTPSTSWGSDLATQCVVDTAEDLLNQGMTIDLAAPATLEGQEVAVIVSSKDGQQRFAVVALTDCTEVTVGRL